MKIGFGVRGSGFGEEEDLTQRSRRRRGGRVIAYMRVLPSIFSFYEVQEGNLYGAHVPMVTGSV